MDSEPKVSNAEAISAFLQSKQFIGLAVAVVAYWFGDAGLKWFNLGLPLIQEIIPVVVSSGLALATYGLSHTAVKEVKLKKAVETLDRVQEAKGELSAKLDQMQESHKELMKVVSEGKLPKPEPARRKRNPLA